MLSIDIVQIRTLKAYIRRSSRNSDAGATAVTRRRSRARVQASEGYARFSKHYDAIYIEKAGAMQRTEGSRGTMRIIGFIKDEEIAKIVLTCKPPLTHTRHT